MPAFTDARPVSILPADFEFLRTFIRTRAAIVLDPGKEYLVESRLGPLAKHEGFASIAELVGRLRIGRDRDLARKVVDAMTTNETSFFRDVHPFEALRTTILPEVIERRRATRTLNLWCAAVSSGQEAYSICMVLREHFPALASWNLRILATDLSPTMIEKARIGRYSQLEVNRGLPAAYLVKYFTREGAGWQVKPDLRAMVEFKLLNLVEPWGNLGQFDIVFIRNVLIYFDRGAKQTVLRNVRAVMPRGGYLVLGSSETLFNVDDGWLSQPAGKSIVYRAP